MKKTWTNIVIPAIGVVAASVAGAIWAHSQSANPTKSAAAFDVPVASTPVSSPAGANPIAADTVTRFVPFQVGPAGDVGRTPTAGNAGSNNLSIVNNTVESPAGPVSDPAIVHDQPLGAANPQSASLAAPVVVVASGGEGQAASPAANNPQQSPARVSPTDPTFNVGQATINVGSAVINVSSDFKLNYGGKTVATGSNGSVTTP